MIGGKARAVGRGQWGEGVLGAKAVSRVVARAWRSCDVLGRERNAACAGSAWCGARLIPILVVLAEDALDLLDDTLLAGFEIGAAFAG